MCVKVKVKVKWSRYRPGVVQRVGRGIALLFHDRGTRRGWVVSSTPRPHFNPGKDPVPILQEAGWAPGPVWTGGKSRPHQDSTPDRPAHMKYVCRKRKCIPIIWLESAHGLVRLRGRLEYNIKTGLWKTGCDVLNWTEIAQCGVQ